MSSFVEASALSKIILLNIIVVIMHFNTNVEKQFDTLNSDSCLYVKVHDDNNNGCQLLSKKSNFLLKGSSEKHVDDIIFILIC